MAVKKMSEWQNIGCMGTCTNTTPETSVDATYHKIEAFTDVAAQLNTVCSIVNNNITVTDAGIYEVNLSVRGDGGAKTFVYAIFVNNVETFLAPSDKADGHISIQGMITVPAGAVIDVRQKSTDGGTTLTVTRISLSLERLT